MKGDLRYRALRLASAAQRILDVTQYGGHPTRDERGALDIAVLEVCETLGLVDLSTAKAADASSLRARLITGSVTLPPSAEGTGTP
jgi:hypothetical protein